MNLAALWTYQKERFPLARTLPLLGVFSAAAIAVSAAAGGRPYPGWGGFAAGLVLAAALQLMRDPQLAGQAAVQPQEAGEDDRHP